MTKELNSLQKELLKMFYSSPKSKAFLNKTKRKKLWDLATERQSIDNMSEIRQFCPALAHRIEKSYDCGKNIQSAVFSECVYSQSLANMFGLTGFYICDENSDNCIPLSYKKLLEEHSLHARYVYTNSDKSKMLIQAGGCNGIDSALIIKENQCEKLYTIEYKESYAKASEPDLPKYKEDGNLLITDEFIERYPQFEQMLNEQTGLNFFEVMGNNIHEFSPESINTAVTENYANKTANVIVTEDCNDVLIMLPSNHIDLWADLEGEIRPAGRNPYKVWTPNALKQFILEKGGVIENGIVTMNKDCLPLRRQRGNKGAVSGRKINPLFFIRVKHYTEVGSNIKFRLENVFQLNPTITGKMKFKNTSTHQELASYYK